MSAPPLGDAQSRRSALGERLNGLSLNDLLVQ
jgi:hypothetical protein